MIPIGKFSDRMVAKTALSAQSASFELRRGVSDDIYAILRDAEVFSSFGGGGYASNLSSEAPERHELLRRLADDIADYVVG